MGGVFNLSSKTKSALILFGSPRLNGFSALLMNKLVKHLNDYDIRYIYTYESDIRPCIDCGFCKNIQGCRFSDMSYVDRSLHECDVIAVISPVYNYSFPAPLKAVLDRTQRYFSAKFSMGIRQIFEKHKKAILLATAGSNDTEGIKIMEKQLNLVFKCINAELVGSVLLKGTDYIDKDNHDDPSYIEVDRQIDELSKKLLTNP